MFLDTRSVAPNMDQILVAAIALSAIGVLVSATGWFVPYGTVMRTLTRVACATADWWCSSPAEPSAARAARMPRYAFFSGS